MTASVAVQSLSVGNGKDAESFWGWEYRERAVAQNQEAPSLPCCTLLGCQEQGQQGPPYSN